nr:MauE/DoxX family redox-associated membrane protein [Herbaspirillum rhizosphaerae]
MPILVAAVFATSGILKSADGAETLSFLRRLPLPGWLKNKTVAGLIPLGDFVLAAALVLAGGGWFLAVGVATLAVTLAYLAIVVWAWRAPEEIACNCFGSLRREPVSGRTVARNGVLVTAAVVLVLMGAFGYPGVPAQVLSMRADDLAWLLLVLCLAAALGWSWLRRPGLTAPSAIGAAPVAEHADQASQSWSPILPPPSSLEHARARTEGMRLPPIELVSRAGDIVYLDKLNKKEDRLVFFIQSGCDACAEIMPLMPLWETLLRGKIEVMAVSQSPRAEFMAAHPEVAHFTCYGGLSAAEKLSIVVSPSMVLLGHEGVVLAGPIAGPDEIAAFMTGLIRAAVPTPDTHRRPLHPSYIYATSEGKS